MEKGLKKIGGTSVHLEIKGLREKIENTNNVFFHLEKNTQKRCQIIAQTASFQIC